MAKSNARERYCIRLSWTLIVRAKVFGVKSNLAVSSSQMFFQILGLKLLEKQTFVLDVVKVTCYKIILST